MVRGPPRGRGRELASARSPWRGRPGGARSAPALEGVEKVLTRRGTPLASCVAARFARRSGRGRVAPWRCRSSSVGEARRSRARSQRGYRNRGIAITPINGADYCSPSEAVVPGKQAGRSLSGKANAGDGWRVVSIGTTAMSPIWRNVCQGVRVDGHVLVGVAGCVVAAGGAVRASAGSRRWSCSYSGAGYPKTFVRRTSAVYCRARRPVGTLLRRLIAELVCASREARAASLTATGCGLGS